MFVKFLFVYLILLKQHKISIKFNQKYSVNIFYFTVKFATGSMIT